MRAIKKIVVNPRKKLISADGFLNPISTRLDNATFLSSDKFGSTSDFFMQRGCLSSELPTLCGQLARRSTAKLSPLVIVTDINYFYFVYDYCIRPDLLLIIITCSYYYYYGYYHFIIITSGKWHYYNYYYHGMVLLLFEGSDSGYN